MIVLDLRGRIVVFNQATQKLFGWNSDEIFGQDIGQVSPALAELVFNTKEQVSREISIPDSSATILDAQISALFSENHKEIGKLLVLRDITEHKQAEEALREAEWKFRALFENGPIGVSYHRMIYDKLGKPLMPLHILFRACTNNRRYEYW